MINYRFKGRVAFDYMDENELLSYLKHSNVTPHDLMLLYDQNKGSLNRFGQPIITPAVISRIYARASVYQFP